MCTSIHIMCTLIHMMTELRDRLARTRRLTTPWSCDPTRGMSSTRLDELLERWQHDFDWTVHERRIAALPWETVRAGDTDLRDPPTVRARRGPSRRAAARL